MDTVFVLTATAQEHQMSGQLGGHFDKDMMEWESCFWLQLFQMALIIFSKDL